MPDARSHRQPETRGPPRPPGHAVGDHGCRTGPVPWGPILLAIRLCSLAARSTRSPGWLASCTVPSGACYSGLAQVVECPLDPGDGGVDIFLVGGRGCARRWPFGACPVAHGRKREEVGGGWGASAGERVAFRVPTPAGLHWGRRPGLESGAGSAGPVLSPGDRLLGAAGAAGAGAAPGLTEGRGGFGWAAPVPKAPKPPPPLRRSQGPSRVRRRVCQQSRLAFGSLLAGAAPAAATDWLRLRATARGPIGSAGTRRRLGAGEVGGAGGGGRSARGEEREEAEDVPGCCGRGSAGHRRGARSPRLPGGARRRRAGGDLQALRCRGAQSARSRALFPAPPSCGLSGGSRSAKGAGWAPRGPGSDATWKEEGGREFRLIALEGRVSGVREPRAPNAAQRAELLMDLAGVARSRLGGPSSHSEVCTQQRGCTSEKFCRVRCGAARAPPAPHRGRRARGPGAGGTAGGAESRGGGRAELQTLL